MTNSYKQELEEIGRWFYESTLLEAQGLLDAETTERLRKAWCAHELGELIRQPAGQKRILIHKILYYVVCFWSEEDECWIAALREKQHVNASGDTEEQALRALYEVCDE